MNTHTDETLPARRVPVLLALGAFGLATLASMSGLLIADLYRDTAEGVRQAKAADLVTLFLAVPALALGLWTARSGSAIGRMLTIGTLAYLAYSYAIYAYSVIINPMTPVHIAVLGLSTWAALLMASDLRHATYAGVEGVALPRRTTGGFLLVVAGLFLVFWSAQIAGAITSGTLPASNSCLNLPTTPVYALDLAFALPLLVLAGTWYIRRDRRGAAAALAALGFTVLMGASVLAIFVVDAAAGAAVELPPMVIFGAVTGIAAALLASGLRGSRAAAGRPALRMPTHS
ncbi:MAG: hypothetical protein LH650_02705 [Chloroflexi bacterium]|nr:hypothetical protein [Chloroflexota bacterium]